MGHQFTDHELRNFQAKLSSSLLFAQKNEKKIQNNVSDNNAPEDTEKVLREKGISILDSKKPSERTSEDVDVLVDMVSSIPLFKKLDLKKRRDVCKIATLEKSLREGIIFRQGDRGNKFYVVVKGTVEVEVRHTETSTFIAAELGPGQSFGELALSEEDKGERTATIRTSSQSACFMVIEKEPFLEIIAGNYMAEDKEQIACFKRNYLFKDWHKNQLFQLIKASKVVKYRFNEVICKQGLPGDTLFIVKTGGCRILKEIGIPKFLIENPTKFIQSTSAKILLAQVGSGARTCFVEVGRIRRENFFGEALFLSPGNISVKNRAALKSLNLFKSKEEKTSEKARQFQSKLVCTVRARKLNRTKLTFKRDRDRFDKILRGVDDYGDNLGSLVATSLTEVFQIKIADVLRVATAGQQEKLQAISAQKSRMMLFNPVTKALLREMRWEAFKVATVIQNSRGCCWKFPHCQHHSSLALNGLISLGALKENTAMGRRNVLKTKKSMPARNYCYTGRNSVYSAICS